MLKNRLKEDLYKLYTNVPPSKDSTVKDTILKVRKIVSETSYIGLTFWEFYFQQLRFIRKKVWAIQFLILLFCGLKLYDNPGPLQLINMISSIAPLFFISGITEISRTYTYGTAELELSTTYTLNQIMMARISILGLINILSLTILGTFIGIQSSLNFYSIFIYICIPFMVTSFGCLWILNRFKNKECIYYCYIFGILIMGTVLISTRYSPKLYLSYSLWVWSIMFFVAIIGVFIQIYKLVSNCSKKNESIISNHI